MTLHSRLLAGCALAWAVTGALPALAQTATDTPPPAVVVVEPAPAPTPAPEPVIVVTDPNAGRFAALPTGQQKIAQSLYDAQGTAATTWSKDDIAAARGKTGWGQVFRSMQADGVVQARNLGQVVSAGNHTVAPQQSPVTISYGNGASTSPGTVTTGHRHTATTVTTAGGGAGGMTTHANSHGHAATLANSTTSAAGGTVGGGHGGGGGGRGNKH